MLKLNLYLLEAYGRTALLRFRSEALRKLIWVSNSCTLDLKDSLAVETTQTEESWSSVLKASRGDLERHLMVRLFDRFCSGNDHTALLTFARNQQWFRYCLTFGGHDRGQSHSR